MATNISARWLAPLLLIPGLLISSAPATAKAPATAVVRVSPVDSSGAVKPGYRVVHRYSGARCQSRSEMTGTAYRCYSAQAPGGVYDPCWVGHDDTRVACLVKPWKHRVVQLTVTGGYDDTDPFRRQPAPWGVLLASGRHCLFVPGSTRSVNGRPVRYYCSRHVALAGRFDRSHPRWRIRSYRDTTPHAADSTYVWRGVARVATAWFGQPSRRV